MSTPVIIPNANFESGNTEWTNVTNPSAWTVLNTGSAFDGTWSIQFNGSIMGYNVFLCDDYIPCSPGQSITARAMVQQGASSAGQVGASVQLWFFDSANNYLASFGGNNVNDGSSGAWHESVVTATAPANTAYVKIGGAGNRVANNQHLWMDTFTWNFEYARTVTVTSPTEGQAFATGAVVPFACTIGGTSPPIASVAYKYGATTIGTSTTDPFNLNSSTLPVGSHAITAVATGTDGSTFTSAAVNITIAASPYVDREYSASNAYTYLVAENFAGLTANMPSTALVTGVELVLDYAIRALIRSKDLDVADPTLANSAVAFDITDGGTIETILLEKDGTDYTSVGINITQNISLDRTDFSIVEEGVTQDGKKWSVMDKAIASVTMGNETALFGAGPLAAQEFATRAIGLRFYPVLGTKPSYADSGDACFRFLLDKLRLRVYFDAGSSEYYFASPDKTQVLKGELVASYVESGNLETGDASGVLQLRPELEVMAGSQTWIADDWTIHAAFPVTDANQIGEVGERVQEDGIGMTYNGLPSQQAVIDNRSRYQFISANFFGDASLDSIYGAHGLPRAFAYNGDFFYKIHTQPDAEKDKPRHVEYHHSHLALGFADGRVDMSVVGEPYNFDGADGASSHAIGDKITGLQALSGTILGVFGSKSIWGISGTTVDNFATQVISPKMGAVEYTVTDMGYPVYANAYGIYTLSQTQQYGDYLGTPMSQDISPWLRPRLVRKITSDKEVQVAWPVRSKNQYRLAFSDGYTLSMTLNGQQAVPTFSFQKYFITEPDTIPDPEIELLSYDSIVPVAVSSELDHTGEERVHVAHYWGRVAPSEEPVIPPEETNTYIASVMYMGGLVPMAEWKFVIPYSELEATAPAINIMTTDAQPASVGRGGAWSPDGDHFCHPQDALPYMAMFKRNGTALEIQSPPTTTSNRDIGWCAAWNPDSTRMAFGQQGNGGTYPYVIIYARSGDAYTQVASINNMTTGTNKPRSMSYSADGTLLALQTTEATGLYLYTVSGDTYTKQVGFGTVPTGAGKFTAFSGDYLAYTCNHATQSLTFYKRSGATLSTLNTFNIQFGTGTLAWNSDASKCAVLAANGTGRPVLEIYSRTGDVFSLLTSSNLTEDGTSTGTSLNPASMAFTPDRLLVAIEATSGASVPGIRVYDATTFARIPAEDINFPTPSAGEYRPAEKGLWAVTITETP